MRRVGAVRPRHRQPAALHCRKGQGCPLPGVIVIRVQEFAGQQVRGADCHVLLDQCYPAGVITGQVVQQEIDAPRTVISRGIWPIGMDVVVGVGRRAYRLVRFQ